MKFSESQISRLIRATSIFASVVITIGVSIGPVDASDGNVYPIPTKFQSSFSATHLEYPATDIFAKCGTDVVAPVTGSVGNLRRIDQWRKQTDNYWHRGGKFVSIIGEDGVRYYLSHLETIVDGVAIGQLVHVGQLVGTVGKTGRAGACHLHFGISPPCKNPEWWVRRGVISPSPYLKDWRSGIERGPAAEIRRWLSQNPETCQDLSQLP